MLEPQTTTSRPERSRSLLTRAAKVLGGLGLLGAGIAHQTHVDVALTDISLVLGVNGSVVAHELKQRDNEPDATPSPAKLSPVSTELNHSQVTLEDVEPLSTPDIPAVNSSLAVPAAEIHAKVA